MCEESYCDPSPPRVRLDVMAVEQVVLLEYQLDEVGELAFSAGIPKWSKREGA